MSIKRGKGQDQTQRGGWRHRQVRKDKIWTPPSKMGGGVNAHSIQPTPIWASPIPTPQKDINKKKGKVLLSLRQELYNKDKMIQCAVKTKRKTKATKQWGYVGIKKDMLWLGLGKDKPELGLGLNVSRVKTDRPMCVILEPNFSEVMVRINKAQGCM